MVVALIEWFVYVVDNSACCEITFICLPRVFSPTTVLSYQTSSFPDDFGRWKRNSFIGFKTLKYFSKEETGQKGLSFAIIISPSRPAWTSCSLWIFVISSFVFTTQRLPCELTFISKSVFFSWRRFCLPRRQKNSIIPKKPLFSSVVSTNQKRGNHDFEWINNNYSMSPRWIWSDKITKERVARVGYNHFISNKGEWNNCFSKFSNMSNRVLPPIFISTILQSDNF